MRAVSVMLLAALCGGVGTAAYGAMAPEGSTPLSRQSSRAGSPEIEQTTFTDADQGSCVNWTPGEDGANSGFNRVSCAKAHRFEVSAREDLGQYPTSEFGPDAQRPHLERQHQLTDELCVGPTLRYLKGRYDPEGRYSISPILPPASAWAEGDRTMLCGVMVPDAEGRSVETTGLAAETDQSRVFGKDACVQVKDNTPNQVPCAVDHTWQVTDTIDLSEVFHDAWPPVDKQNDFLNKRCTDAAREYLGGDDPLYYSTLTPFWTTIHSQSWEAGSHTVNCALTFGRPGGGFGVLKGDVRHDFTIDGAPPAKLPERKPLRNQQQHPGAPAPGAGQ